MARRSQFRPCIDLHSGVVKQIVGGTLDLENEAGAGPKENFVAEWVQVVRFLTAGNRQRTTPSCTALMV